MKELSIEEKAKRYDEAIKRAREYDFSLTGVCAGDIIEDVFPELKESENERIRKELLNHLKKASYGKTLVVSTLDYKRWADWLEKQGESNLIEEIKRRKELLLRENEKAVSLDEKLSLGGRIAMLEELLAFTKEKQGEQKLANKIEPKFKVGDKIIEKDFDECGCGTIIDIKDGKYIFDDGCFIRIEEQSLWQLVKQKPTNKVEPKFKNGQWIVWQDKYYKVINNGCCYELVDQDGLSTSLEYGTIDENARLWDITKDAKDGDVLADGNLPFIFKKIDTNKYSYAYCGISVDDGFKIVSDGEFSEWTWMQDIKPATKEQRELLFQKMHEAGYEWDAEKKELKKIEQKPAAWSEEDERHLNSIIKRTVAYGDSSIYGLIKDDIDWLKSIKDRVQPQQEYKWSEDIPYWKKSTLPNDSVTGFNSDFFSYNGYCINYKELFDKLPKED